MMSLKNNSLITGGINMELKHDHLTRQLDIISPSLQTKSIHVLGAGAIGSFLVLELAKCGWTDITVYDYDTVSIENMSNQFFRFSDIGKPKVEALKDLIKDFTQVEIKAVNTKLDGSEFIGKGQNSILFYAIDSMAIRKAFTDKIGLTFFDLILDARMGAEMLNLFTFTPLTVSDYDKSLFDDSQALPERCTSKSTIYTACMAASFLVKVLKNFTVNENYLKFLSFDIKGNAPFASFEVKR